MTSLIEFTPTLAMIALLVVGARHLRRTQPDPNPAYEAREAAKEAARLAQMQDAADTEPALIAGQQAAAVPEDRRTQSLPHVGTERRQQMAREAQAWRNAA